MGEMKEKRIFGKAWSASFSLATDDESELMRAFEQAKRKWVKKIKESKTVEIILSDGERFEFLIKSVEKNPEGFSLELEVPPSKRNLKWESGSSGEKGAKQQKRKFTKPS